MHSAALWTVSRRVNFTSDFLSLLSTLKLQLYYIISDAKFHEIFCLEIFNEVFHEVFQKFRLAVFSSSSHNVQLCSDNVCNSTGKAG